MKDLSYKASRNSKVDSINSMPVGEAPIKTKSDKYLEKLDRSYSKKDDQRNPLIKLSQQVFSYFKNIWRKSDGYVSSDEHNRTIMIQENLQTHGEVRGSFDEKQLKTFSKHLKKKDSPSLKSLRKNLKQVTTLQEVATTSLFPWGDHSAAKARNTLSNKLVTQVSNLQPGESMWVDMTSTPGQHSLKGRIERTSEGYIFQMSNTGAGVPEHSDWHKKAFFQKGNFYQTVVQWGPFDTSDKFSKAFFQDIINACVEGKVPAEVKIEKMDGKGDNGEDLQAIDAIYKTLGHHLKNPTDLPLNEKNKAYWSTLQEGSSCVPNSIWALVRVSLPENEYQDLRTEIQLHNLKHLYSSIVSGNDRTDYALLLAYEQVTKLIIEAETKGKAAPQLLKDIRADLVERSTNAQLKVKIKNRNPRLIIDAETKNVELKAGRLKRLPGSLRAKVYLEPVLSEGAPVTIKIERNSRGEPIGVSTLALLLYDAILRDDDNEIETKLKAFTDFLNGIEDPSEIVADKEEFRALTKMFYILGMDLREVDGTMQSRPKQLAITSISEALYTVLYAKSCKEEASPFVDNSAINRADFSIYKDVKMLKNEALTYNRAASKATKATPESLESNIWYKIDRATRVFHFKNKWQAYSQRMSIDASIEQKVDDQLTLGVGIKQIRFSDTTKKTVALVGLPEIAEGKNTIQSLFFSQEFGNDRVPLKEINVAFARIRDRELPEIDIQFVNNQPVASSFAGNAYLLYRLLPGASLEIDKLQQIERLMDTMRNLPVQESEIETIKAVAGYLNKYCVDFRQLDLSPESIALQQIAARLSVALLNKINLDFLFSFWGPLYPAGFQEEVDYYEILNPKEYLKFKNNDPAKQKGDLLIKLIDHPMIR